MYIRTWAQMFGRSKPGSAIGRVSHVIGHTEAGADLPASATVAQEVQRVRAIDAYHRSLGWGGFGYSVFVAQSGRVYEGRGYRRSGAHTQGFNMTALAWVVPGHGDRTAWSDACIAGIRAWIGHGIDGGHIASDPRTTGHRDHAAKSCPGNKTYPQLGRVRGVTGSQPSPTPPGPDPVEEAMHAGRVVHLDKRGGTAYVPDPTTRTLWPLAAPWQALAVTGDEDWNRNSVVVARKDVSGAGWRIAQ